MICHVHGGVNVFQVSVVSFNPFAKGKIFDVNACMSPSLSLRTMYYATATFG